MGDETDLLEDEGLHEGEDLVDGDLPEGGPPDGTAPEVDSAPRDGQAPATGPVASAAPGPGRSALRVKILSSNALELCSPPPEGQVATPGALAIVPTRYGNELGKVLGPESNAQGELRPILRMATPADLAKIEENGARENKAFHLCREKIESRGMDMKLVSAHYLLDEQKILFLFSSENRVDFRELVRDLVSAFKMRIELRQIGVRDEARVVGGLGICGRALCCNAVTDKLRPVSIKMAKEQNLTLNSMKISGPCGRLLCCLSYEYDVYREARQTLPSLGTRVPFEGEEFRVVEVNALARRVRFQGETGRVIDVGQDGLARNAETQAWELRPRTGGSAH
jgi:cell fate regulator YaaT (PSP1 superfamily)